MRIKIRRGDTKMNQRRGKGGWGKEKKGGGKEKKGGRKGEVGKWMTR